MAVHRDAHLRPLSTSVKSAEVNWLPWSVLARHFALESDDLEGVADGLLAAGLKPFQGKHHRQHRKELPDSSNLTFGIGTIFVFDPDMNLLEFVDPTRGIFPDILRRAE